MLTGKSDVKWRAASAFFAGKQAPESAAGVTWTTILAQYGTLPYSLFGGLCAALRCG